MTTSPIRNIPSGPRSAAMLLLAALAGCGRGEPAPEASLPASEATGASSSGAAPSVRSNTGTTPTAPEDRVAAVVRPIRLRDATVGSGLDVEMTCGRLPASQILEVNGGGLGLIDIENDGDLDVFVAVGATLESPGDGPGCRLFRNDGGLHFTDVTAAAGIALHRWANGVAIGDVDGDGFDDIFVACFGANALLRNRGDGTFVDATDAAGPAVGDARWATSAAFGDPDLDGDLDLYVVNYLQFDPAAPPPRARHKGVDVLAGPHGLPAQHDLLLENRGDGTFDDATGRAGALPLRPAYGLNVVIADLAGDARPDVLVGNDSMANFLFVSDGAPRTLHFEEDGVRSGIASNIDGSDQATMGIAVGDVDGDGRPDVFTTNFSNDTNTLHLNTAEGFFDDRTRLWGLGQVSRPYLGWSCAFADLDHDGDEDLLAFNGHVYPEATMETMDSAYEQPPLLFRREARTFVRMTAGPEDAWLARVGRDRTAVFADLDRDGDLDVVVGELNGPVRILENLIDDGRATSIVVALDDATTPGNRRALGAIVELETDAGRMRRWIVGGGGFQSSLAPEVHFGVPKDRRVTALRVRWPDGTWLETPEPPRPGLPALHVVRRTTEDRCEIVVP